MAATTTTTSPSALFGMNFGDANGLMDPLYAGQAAASAYQSAQMTLPTALSSYQQQHTADDGTNDMDASLIQSAMRYVMNMPLETQYYERSTGSTGYTKPLEYSSTEQRDWVEQHESDKQAYDTLVKSSSSGSSTGQGTSLLGDSSSLLTLYQTLLGGNG